MKKATFFVSYLSYITLFTVTVFWTLFYRQSFFFLLTALEICLPVFSYFLSGYCLNRLEPALYFRPITTVKGERANLFLHLKNPTRIPFASAMVSFSIRSGFYDGKEESVHILSLRALHNNELVFPITLTKCGLYEASISLLQGFDYLHLFRFDRKLDLSAQIRVFPHMQPKEERHDALYSEGFDEFEESAKSGNVSSNVTDIREYLPGDRLQKIHWKLSSKIDKLMVKENESTSTNEFFLLLELFQPSEESCGENALLRNALDNALDEAWSLSLELIEEGEIFTFASYSTAREDFIMSTIRCREDLENAFSECFYEPSYDTENLALDIYEKTGMKKGTLLHVTHKGVADVPAEF